MSSQFGYSVANEEGARERARVGEKERKKKSVFFLLNPHPHPLAGQRKSKHITEE